MPRRSPRALALWSAALAVAVVTAVVVGGDLAALHRRAAGLGPRVDAVIATRDLPLGHRLTPADLHARTVYRSQLPAGVATRRRALVGQVVAVPVVEGAYLVTGNVAPRRRTGLDGVVPRGMRAMRIVVTDALRPRPGAAVDVLASFDPGAAGERDDGTVVVAAGVTVVDTDRRSGSGAGRAGAAGVTLLVDPRQARALADAQANGVVTLALVPPEDAAHP
jgi:Flp pilus assembly protein CpaB